MRYLRFDSTREFASLCLTTSIVLPYIATGCYQGKLLQPELVEVIL